MNTFKNGDRVQHSVHGFAGVLQYDEARKLVEIVPDGYGGNSCHVHPDSLTPVPTEPKFKIGDRVSHPMHRDGTVEDIQANGLHVVNVGGNRAYYALEHQITPAVPEPTYHICISEITGAAHVPGNLTAKQVANYIADNVDWRVVQEIKITKEG